MVTREEGAKVPFAVWDPDGKGEETMYSSLARPMRVSLGRGDMLYLPALWYVFSCSQKTMLMPGIGIIRFRNPVKMKSAVL